MFRLWLLTEGGVGRVSATLKYLEQNMYDDGMETLAPVRAFSDIPIVYISDRPATRAH